MEKKFLCCSLLGVVAFLFLSSSLAYGMSGCESDCKKCHSLTVPEAQQLLGRAGLKDVLVSQVKMSAVKGLWEVSIERLGERGSLYMPFSKRHIVNGKIYDIGADESRTRRAGGSGGDERYVKVSRIPVTDALVIGNRAARHKVIVFTDPDCPFCSKLHWELKKVAAQRKDIAFYLKFMPLEIHPNAYWKSKSVLCAMELKGSKVALQMVDDNFERKPVQQLECATSAVEETMRLGDELGISGTPTLVMPNGLVLSGFKDAAAIIGAVDGSAKLRRK